MPDQGRPVPSLCGATRSSTQTGTARGRPVTGSSGPVCASGAGGSSSPWRHSSRSDWRRCPRLRRAPDSRPLGRPGRGAYGRRPVVGEGRAPGRLGPATVPHGRDETGTGALRLRTEASTRAASSGPSRLTATESPLIVTGAQASAGLKVSLTAVGMVASPAARRIQVTYDDGRQATIPPRRAEPEPGARSPAGPLPVRRVRRSRHLVGAAAGHRERLRQDALGQHRSAAEPSPSDPVKVLAVHGSPLFISPCFWLWQAPLPTITSAAAQHLT